MGSMKDFSYYIRESVSDFMQLQPTLPKSQVPKELWEPAIEKGYRPINQPWRYYLTSLFQIHNETVNVWTHLIGFVVIWWFLGEYTQDFNFWQDKHSWPLLVFGITCLLCCLGSSFSHLLHSRSKYYHYTVFMIDYIGVTIYAFGTGIQSFYGCSDKGMYTYFENIYLPMLTTGVILNYVVLCLAKIWYGHDPHNMRRKVMQIGIMSFHAVLVMSPFVPRYYHCFFQQSCSLSSLNHMTTNTLLFCACAFFFGTHLPEKLFPGKCDIIGHGHQIFHVLMTFNQVSQFHAMHVDIQTGATSHADPDIVRIMSIFFFIISVEIGFYFVFEKFVPRGQDSCHQQGAKHTHKD